MADKPAPPKIGFFEWMIIALLVFVGLSMFVPVGTSDVLNQGIFNILIYVLYRIFFAVLPFGMLILLGYVAFKMWKHYINQDFISGIDWVLLEIIPPREVLRSPKAMELFLTNALYHYSNKGGMEEYWQGAVWFWFSLEIVSLEGQVHFYIRTPTRIRGLIETQMYAQYPQAQVKVAEDYTNAVDEISPRSQWRAYGCEWKLKKPEAYPIKTYVDFGLDKDPKEEYKVDPISPVIELMGSLQKDEQMWMQIVITPSKKMWHTPGTWFGKHNWVKESQAELLRWLAPYTAVRKKDNQPGQFSKEVRVPGFLDSVVKAMSAKTGKLGFETGIRTMYVAKKEAYSQNNRRNMRLLFRQYAKPDCNEFKRCNHTAGDAYGGIFSISPETVMRLANRMLLEYRERSFFHSPMRHHLFSNHTIPWPFSPAFFPAYFHAPTYVLNTEEIATLWHFPGQILKVPTLERIESKEATPPPNLPI